MMTREEAIKILSSESYIGNSKLDDAIEYAIEALSEPTKTDILSDIADLKKSPWFTFGENSLNPISREQYLARKEAVEVIEDLCIKRIDSEPTKTDTKRGAIDKGKVLDILIKHQIEINFDAFDEMWEEVDALPFTEPTRPKAKWIRVDERLPETDNENNVNRYDVLLWVKNKNHPEREPQAYIGKLMKVKGSDGSDNFWGIKTKDCEWTIWGWSYFNEPEVLAWMPLPEPYNAEMESE